MTLRGETSNGGIFRYYDLPPRKRPDLRLPCCLHELSMHTSNGFPVECECGCRALIAANGGDA